VRARRRRRCHRRESYSHLSHRNGVSFAAAEMAGPARVGTALGVQNTILLVSVAIALAALCPLVGRCVLGPLAARERRPPIRGSGSPR